MSTTNITFWQFADGHGELVFAAGLGVFVIVIVLILSITKVCVSFAQKRHGN